MNAREIAETFINGNRKDAVQAIAEQGTQLEAALLALGVFESLRGIGGVHMANDFRRAIEARTL